MRPTRAGNGPLPPPAPLVVPPETEGRTTLVVRLGLLALTVIGVLSIFGEALLGPGGPTTDLGNTNPRGNAPPAAP